MTFDIDAHGQSDTQELGQRQRIANQQNVLDPCVECGRNRAQQRAGGLDVQRCRIVAGAGIGIQLRARSGQCRRGRQHAPPTIGLINNVRVVCVLLEQRCPAGE
ncbi:Uncharacterised protein [Mycobacteroides abscessus subsp. abscessus]|nr:Uncharacterised protein [Mycobacteroides abscessus subsp. abscessus]